MFSVACDLQLIGCHYFSVALTVFHHFQVKGIFLVSLEVVERLLTHITHSLMMPRDGQDMLQAGLLSYTQVSSSLHSEGVSLQLSLIYSGT